MNEEFHYTEEEANAIIDWIARSHWEKSLISMQNTLKTCHDEESEFFKKRIDYILNKNKWMK